jgi:hypothetical protein
VGLHRYPSRSIYRAAMREVARAKREGRWRPEPCVRCGTLKNVVGHHEDYRRPLDVTWLCLTHHRLRHSEINLERYGRRRPGVPYTHTNGATARPAA